MPLLLLPSLSFPLPSPIGKRLHYCTGFRTGRAQFERGFSSLRESCPRILQRWTSAIVLKPRREDGTALALRDWLWEEITHICSVRVLCHTYSWGTSGCVSFPIVHSLSRSLRDLCQRHVWPKGIPNFLCLLILVYWYLCIICILFVLSSLLKDFILATFLA